MDKCIFVPLTHAQIVALLELCEQHYDPGATDLDAAYSALTTVLLATRRDTYGFHRN